jgi:hypothetical protein
MVTRLLILALLLLFSLGLAQRRGRPPVEVGVENTCEDKRSIY